MNSVINNFGSIVIWLGVADAILVLCVGLIAAFLVVTGKDSDIFWRRVMPATWILVGTSIAAGVIVFVARWIAHILS